MKQWTEARLRSFVMSGIRRMTSRWGPKYSTFNKAFVEHQLNPKTKRKRKMYRCAVTNKLFPASEMQIDHIDPVVPIHWSEEQQWLGYNWNDVLPRMFCGEENLQAVSRKAHKEKTKIEASNRERGRIKKIVKETKPNKLKKPKTTMMLKNLERPSLNKPLLKGDRDDVYQQSFDVCSGVAKEFGDMLGTTPELMFSKLRQRIPTMARQMSMYVLDKLGINRPYITWFFNRNRTSIYGSLKSAQNTIDTDSRLGDIISDIINKYKND